MSTYYLEKETHYWRKVLLEGSILWSLLLLVHYLVRGHLALEYQFLHPVPMLFGSWMLATLLSKKFKALPNPCFPYELKVFMISSLAWTSVLTICLYFHFLYPLSRFIVYLTIIVLCLSEIIYLLYRHFKHFIFSRHKNTGYDRLNVQIFILFICELVTVLLIIFTFCYSKRNILLPNYDFFIIILFFTWILVSLFTHQFKIDRNQNYIKTLFPFLKSQFFFVTFVAILVYLLELPTKFTLGLLAIFSQVEILLVSAFYIYQKPLINDESISRLLPIPVIEDNGAEEVFFKPEPRSQPYEIPSSTILTVSLKEKLEKVFLVNSKNIFSFITAIINLDKIDLLKAVFYYTSNPYNIEIIGNNSMAFIMNLQVVNNFRRINQYFIEVNRKLTDDGIFIGNFESIKQRTKRLYQNYPLIFANLFYLVDFTYRRICPKLPYLKKVYFALSKGKNRVISRAECLGRLYSCGFELLALKEIENKYYFIAKKIKEPLTDQIPSYGPIFKQRRVGQGGKFIFTYKLRTMYPFSEYLHRSMVQYNNFQQNGKIRDDFRIAFWGKVLRKFWIDEIPMIFNLIKGEIKLVGVRPLSETFFNTYPAHLQELRTRYKPGLIPPFYVDLPNCIEQVWDSEYNYLIKYEKNPFKTDLIYLFKATYNIVFRHAKSA